MKNKLNYIGILILIIIFSLFYFISNHFLSKYNSNKVVPTESEIVNNDVLTNEDEISIISNLYTDARMLYDVVNNKFVVSQDEVIVIGDVIYKKITNFDDVIYNIFTKNGANKYINDLGYYFAYNNDEYYLAGNLVSYQTYYFRGDNTNIYITNSNEEEINGIIYEKWSSNNKNTLATIKAVYENNKWFIDDISILYSE